MNKKILKQTSSKCKSCNCNDGELHNHFTVNGCCDMEICPLCKGQLLSCNCEKFEIVRDNIREPYFKVPDFCQRCRKKLPKVKMIFPEVKMISKEQWKFICGATYPLDCVLCIECINFILDKRKTVKERGKKR
jgi:hypothetical protein